MSLSCKPLIGILGGMGPLASATFLNTIYRFWNGNCEQTAPRVLLYSDPALPDRSEMLLHRNAELLLEHFRPPLEQLCNLGASRLVICCMTIHCLLPRLPKWLQERVISMLQVAFDLVIASPGKHLLLCSSGTRQIRLFEQHPSWPSVCDRIVMVSAEDQNVVHQLIYRVKLGGDIRPVVAQFKSLLRHYEITSFLAACSELHILAHTAFGKEYCCLDPLTTIAERLCHLNESGSPPTN